MAVNTNVAIEQVAKQDSPASVTGKLVYPVNGIVVADTTEVVLGFRPSFVEFVNFTDRISAQHFAGMADNSCLKRNGAGLGTAEAVGITLTDKGFTVSQNATLALVLSNKTCYFRAEA